MGKTKLAPANYRSNGNFLAVKPKGRKQKRDDGEFYRQRNNILRRLGYPSYQDYLASPLWQDIRSRVFGRDKHLCCCCRKRATSVHHAKYTEENLTGKTLDGLTSICVPCHRAIEFKTNGKKRLTSKKVAQALRSRANTIASRRRHQKNLRKKAENRAKAQRASQSQPDRLPDTTGQNV